MIHSRANGRSPAGAWSWANRWQQRSVVRCEETGLDVTVGPVLEVFERVERQDDGVRYHFVIVDYLCGCIGGPLCAGDDAVDVAWVSVDELRHYGVADSAAAVIRKGLARATHEGHEGHEGW
jgi:ADP-ribose pyrophosphatase YjhB (NUDIX family)